MQNYLTNAPGTGVNCKQQLINSSIEIFQKFTIKSHKIDYMKYILYFSLSAKCCNSIRFNLKCKAAALVINWSISSTFQQINLESQIRRLPNIFTPDFPCTHFLARKSIS